MSLTFYLWLAAHRKHLRHKCWPHEHTAFTAYLSWTDQFMDVSCQKPSILQTIDKFRAPWSQARRNALHKPDSMKLFKPFTFTFYFWFPSLYHSKSTRHRDCVQFSKVVLQNVSICYFYLKWVCFIIFLHNVHSQVVSCFIATNCSDLVSRCIMLLFCSWTLFDYITFGKLSWSWWPYNSKLKKIWPNLPPWSIWNLMWYQWIFRFWQHVFVACFTFLYQALQLIVHTWPEYALSSSLFALNYSQMSLMDVP